MAQVVLHVGPGKCGSSSIQMAVRSVAAQLDAPYRAMLARPESVIAMAMGDTGSDEWFHDVLREVAEDPRPFILSHEVLFKYPAVVARMADMASDAGHDVRAVGFVRRQSNYIASAHAQWLFRDADRLHEVREVIAARGLDPDVFSGAERHLVAALWSGFHTARQLTGHLYLDWDDSYGALGAGLSDAGARLVVGVLPSKGFPGDLVAAFHTLAELPGAAGAASANPRFHPDLIEAVSLAVLQGLPMPGPHQDNDVLLWASALMPSPPATPAPFRDLLMAAVDTAFWPSNQAFSLAFDIPQAYFRPDQTVPGPAADDAIVEEEARRRSDPAALLAQGRALAGTMAHVAHAAGRSRDRRSR